MTGIKALNRVQFLPSQSFVELYLGFFLEFQWVQKDHFHQLLLVEFPHPLQ